MAALPRLSKSQRYERGYDILPLGELTSAYFIAPPSFARTRPRLRGALARGIAYEERVATALRATFGHDSVAHGQWIRYATADGAKGYCQSDFYIPCRDRLFIFEAKLTAVERAHQQLLLYYGPLLTHILERPAVLIQVARHVTPESGPLIRPRDIPSLEPSSSRVHTLPLFI